MEELAGFALIDKVSSFPNLEWKMGQFFIPTKFQEKGIGQTVAHKIWKMHPGLWEVCVLPQNKRALSFWRKVISRFMGNSYTEKIKGIDYDLYQPERPSLTFNTRQKSATKFLKE